MYRRQLGKSLLIKWIKEGAEKVGEGQYKVGSVIVWIPTEDQIKRHNEEVNRRNKWFFDNIPPIETFPPPIEEDF